jgi:deoxycytidylate deaminase
MSRIILDKFVTKALRGDIINAKVIAIAYRKSGAIITYAVNKRVVNINGTSDKRSIHAEEMLVRKLRKIAAMPRFKYISVLVLRWSPGKMQWAIAKPCSNCMNELLRYGINQISYSDIDGNITTCKM